MSRVWQYDMLRYMPETVPFGMFEFKGNSGRRVELLVLFGKADKRSSNQEYEETKEVMLIR